MRFKPARLRMAFMSWDFVGSNITFHVQPTRAVGEWTPVVTEWRLPGSAGR